MGKFFGKDRPEELLKTISQLEVTEFLGVCRILGIELVGEEDCERSFEEIWKDLCDRVEGLERNKRRNLGRLVRAAVNGSDAAKR